MRQAFKILAVAVAAAGLSAANAYAQHATASTTPQVPHCTRNVGSISIRNGDTQGWTRYNLTPPAGLLRVVIQQSGCFTIVERGAGLDAAMQERDLASGGQLQHGSNVGGGQIRAADYVLLADVVAQNNNSSGGGVGAAIGGMLGGSFGAAIGGMGVRNQTAQTTLALTNVRTTESLSAEGNAANSNFAWGGIGFLGAGGVGLGGYTDTDIGRVVTMAFIDAYTQLVTQLGVLDTNASASAPQQSYRVTAATPLKSGPGTGSTLRNLHAGAIVYPTGDKQGMWWRVHDENDNDGWVNNDNLEPNH